jgi:cold shock CspA family protein
MNLPLEISFRNVQKRKYLVDLIVEKSRKLDEFCDHISSCRVSIEKVQKHQHSGRRYRVRVDITVPPGHELAVDRNPSKGDFHVELSTEIREAFDAAFRQLKELNAKQHGEVKTHPHQESQAVVEQLFPDQGYGFLETLDGRRIYFHEHSVLHDDFGRLKRGASVWFTEELGEMGPQATTVRVVDTHGSRGAGPDTGVPPPTHGE